MFGMCVDDVLPLAEEALEIVYIMVAGAKCSVGGESGLYPSSGQIVRIIGRRIREIRNEGKSLAVVMVFSHRTITSHYRGDVMVHTHKGVTPGC